MKKLISVLLLAALLASSCMLTSCFHEHVFGEWKTVTKATCTKEGLKERVCECGEKETQAIPMIDHDYASATCEKPKTCTMCGKTSGASLGHNYSKATCDAPQKCSRCGQTVGSALGHTTDDGVCSRCGKNFGKWLKGKCVDRFGDFTHYGIALTSTTTTGKFSNSATTNSTCTIIPTYQDDTFFFQIYDYGTSCVKNSSRYNEYYYVEVRCTSGSTFSAHEAMGILPGEPVFRLWSNKSSSKKLEQFLLTELCKKNNTITIFLQEEDYGVHQYIFSLESSNFKEIYDDIY
ncbi:MAG: hypothetical protein KBS44_05345 [Clostridiales bacterium]|nr:hypothetical protein [Candidatus Coliplasma equi]